MAYGESEIYKKKRRIQYHHIENTSKMFTSGKHMGSNLLTQKRHIHSHILTERKQTQMIRTKQKRQEQIKTYKSNSVNRKMPE